MLKPDVMVCKGAIVISMKILKITENWFYDEKIAFW